MMTRVLTSSALALALTLVIALALTAEAQHQHVPGMQHPSGYADLQTRELKVYSEEEVHALQNGEGMGYALVAELSHYPGPKHVLELATELGLSSEQVSGAEGLFDTMHANAVRLGEELLDKERKLQELFVKGQADGEPVGELVVAIGTLEGKLRWTHLETHVRMRSLLTDAQIQRYDTLRGYR